MIKKITEIERDIEAKDSVELDWFDMQKPNLCAVSKESVEFVVKAKYTHLHEDDILVGEDGYSIRILKSEDDIYTLTFTEDVYKRQVLE